MYEPLKVVSWASAKAHCPIRQNVTSSEEMTFIFGSGRDEFEFSFDVGALHHLLQLGAEALAEMNRCAALEDAEDSAAELAGDELVTAGEHPA